MKIPGIGGIVSIARGQLDQRGAPVRDKQNPAPEADKVELSSQGQSVQRLSAEATSTEQRAAEVAELQRQYESGELATDSQQTAKAMVADGLFDDIILAG